MARTKVISPVASPKVIVVPVAANANNAPVDPDAALDTLVRVLARATARRHHEADRK